MIGESGSVHSMLALDCGSLFTRALLVDCIEGEYRLVARGEAPTTAGPPWSDLMVGVRQALAELSGVTGRHLVQRTAGQAGQIISPEGRRGGVDAVVAISSAGEPLRVALMGIAGEFSLSSGRRALSATYSTVVGTTSMDGHEDETERDEIQDQVRRIHGLRPDAVVIVGGTDGGAGGKVLLRYAQAVALACSALPKEERPTILYAGNAELRSQVTEVVGEYAELRTVDNVRPNLESENPGPLQAELELLHREHQRQRLPGFRELAACSPVQVLPAAAAFARAVEYLAELDGVNVLGVDVGASAVTVARVVEEQLDLTIRTDVGLACHATQVLGLVPAQSVTRWLPFEASRADVSAAILNRGLHCGTLPQTREDLLLEQALARELIQLATRDAEAPSRLHLIVGGGGVLANAPSYAQAALILLDALQPVGIFGLALDALGLLSPLAAMATVHPQAAAQMMEKDGLLNLGTVVAPVGTASPGEIALTARLESEGGATYTVDVPYGSLKIIPLPPGETANLELRPSEEFDVGLGDPGQAARTKVRGGAIGIIVDARGRPLPIAENAEEQRERVKEWLWSMGA